MALQQSWTRSPRRARQSPRPRQRWRWCGWRVLADDSGSATVAAAGIITAVTALLLVVAGIVSHVVGSHRVQVAADLAAVSAATALYYGYDPCVTGKQTAELNGATLTHCEQIEGDVVVTLTVPLAEATSRAGPL